MPKTKKHDKRPYQLILVDADGFRLAAWPLTIAEVCPIERATLQAFGALIDQAIQNHRANMKAD